MTNPIPPNTDDPKKRPQLSNSSETEPDSTCNDLGLKAPPKRTRRLQTGEKLRSADKVERIPVKVIPTTEIVRKPEWMRIRLSASKSTRD